MILRQDRKDFREMNGFVDAETNRKLKDKRTEQRKKKQHNKQKDFDKYIDDSLELLLQKENRKKFAPKPAKAFRNNQKRFQYDYEEDFYEPIYEEDC